MEKKLCISLIFSNFVVSKHKVIIFHAMHNLYANFVKILEICKNFSINLVNELGNIPRPGVVPRFLEADKAKFGTIWYYNNGGNVETFKVRIPISIAYEWGEFTTKVEFTINGTIGD